MSDFISIKPSSILFFYEDIIKTPDLFILKAILNNPKYRSKFEEYLLLSPFDNLEDEILLPMICARKERNLFKWLMIKEFDYKANYEYFKNKFLNMYIQSNPFTILTDIIETYIKHPSIDKIYFFSNEYDKRIEFDIQYTFKDNENNSKIEYATGNLEKALAQFNIQMIFYPYIEEIIPLAREHKDIIFSIPNYGFNLNDEGELIGLTMEDDNIGVYPLLRNSKLQFFG